MSKRQKHRNPQKSQFIHTLEADQTPVPKSKPSVPLEPKTEAQRHYISSIMHNRITFAVGPAGVGKTYVAARMAADLLKAGKIEKIFLTRPAIEAGSPIGFLKGTMEEKMDPYIASYGRGFADGLGEGHLQYHLQAEYGKIEIVPLNFMQGRSFDKPCIVLADEMQNSTQFEMKMLTTRLGKGATLVIDGDPKQIAPALKDKSGLIDGMNKLSYIKQIGSVEFTRGDIVRDGLVREILDAYEAEDSETNSADKSSGRIESGESEFELPGFIRGSAR